MSKLEFNYAREVFKFKWTIDNFQEVLKNKNIKEYRTKKSLNISRPQLRLQLLGPDNDLIGINFLCPINMYLTYEFNVKLGKDLKNGKCDGKMIEANKWQYLGVLLKRDISREWYQGHALEVDIKYRFLNQACPQYTSELSGVIDTSIFADIIIKSNDGREYKAHKFILARNSVVLKAHFEHDMTESHTNIVEAPFESEVLEEIIAYMYKDKMLRINKMPDKILAAADFYQLDGLKKLCGEEMSKQLTVKNASKTLDLADLYHEDTLKFAALEFIKEEIKDFFQSIESWKTEILVDVIKSVYKYVEEKDTQVQYHDDKSE